MSTTSPPWGRYSDLRPDALTAIRAAVPMVYLPLGALEWRGPHLPFGLGGIVASAVTERVVRRTGGVMLPTIWWPITTLPHADSLAVRSEVMRELWVDIFAGLAAAGWRFVVIINGHVTPGHEIVLMDVAEQAMRQHGFLVLVLHPVELVDEEMLDHAALWESSLLMGLRSDLVDLEALGTEPLTPSVSGVIGRDPRGLASVSLGKTTLDLAVERITKAVLQLLRDRDASVLQALYEKRRARYHASTSSASQVSPEDLTLSWWNDIVNTEYRTYAEHADDLPDDDKNPFPKRLLI